MFNFIEIVPRSQFGLENPVDYGLRGFLLLFIYKKLIVRRMII